MSTNVHELFEEQVLNNHVVEAEQITYRELNNTLNQLADYLYIIRCWSSFLFVLVFYNEI